ncbi:MAG: SufE family protein [Clostridia bacterium]|nr:SufE family protein [Clostridia bacterium]
MTIYQMQQDYVSDLLQLNSWFDKYEFFVRIAGMVDGLTEEQKKEKNLVRGCQTKAWVVAEENNGRMQYYVDSDSLIVKGMLNVMADVLSDHTPQEIAASEWTLWQQAGILENLTESRNNGIRAAEQMMKHLAISRI